MRPYGGRAVSSGVQRRGPLYFLSFISYLFSRNEVCQLQQLKQKKIPVRRCVGCNAQRPKRELVRVVRAPVKEDENGVQTGGEVSLDLTGRKPGRGAYVCRDPECLKKAQKARRFERAFSCKIEDAVYDAMYQELCTDVKGKAGEAQK